MFFIVGPTAVGKSALAADLASAWNAEIVSCDAFQIYRGFDILAGKPEPAVLAKALHHLIGSVALTEEMNAGKYRRLALPAIEEIARRGKPVVVVGGNGLYAKALTHGLEGDWKKMDVVTHGVLIVRDRTELHTRINLRVQEMFDRGVIDEVRQEIRGNIGRTAAKMIGLREIRAHLEGRLSLAECVDKIQAATRQYAKRQLTWFRHQSNFESLNLSLLNRSEAVKWTGERAESAWAKQG